MYRPHITWLEDERALSHISTTKKKVKGNLHHPQFKNVHQCHIHVLLKSWNWICFNFKHGECNKNKHFRNVLCPDFEHATFKPAQVLDVLDNSCMCYDWQSKNSFGDNQTFWHCVLLQHTSPEVPQLLVPWLPK